MNAAFDRGRGEHVRNWPAAVVAAMTAGSPVASEPVDPHLVTAILCGGFGTRLWPLSRPERPKQFLRIGATPTTFEGAVRRALAVCPADRLLCVANERHRALAQGAVARQGATSRLLLEPARRNTAPAVAAAAFVAYDLDPEALLLSLPSDHHIPDREAFRASVRQALPAARAGWLVAFGVTPDRASPAYGYIAPGEPLGEGAPGRRVARFVEKPDARRAEELLSAGFVWNAGILLARAVSLIGAFEQHAPEVLRSCHEALHRARRDAGCIRLDPGSFAACPSVAVDRAILERHDRVAVLPFAGEWIDLGSWRAVARHFGETHVWGGRSRRPRHSIRPAHRSADMDAVPPVPPPRLPHVGS
jgi:mannose-1-phosphate guanylyltransferase/mannose-6-phosphate isomerase